MFMKKFIDKSGKIYTWYPTCCNVETPDKTLIYFVFQCPNECENKGRCSERNNPDHKKYNYHFSQVDSDDNVIYKNNKPLCRYSMDPLDKSSECWFLDDEDHNKVFTHNSATDTPSHIDDSTDDNTNDNTDDDTK